MLKNKTNSHSKSKAAFTLVEVILVSAIIGIVAVAAYQTLSTGLKVWEKTRTLSVEEDILIFFDRLSIDLRNAFDFSLLEFNGKPTFIEFPTIVSVPMAKSGSKDVVFYADQIGRVKYGFDSAHQSIFRQQAGYGQAVDEKYGLQKDMAAPVTRVLFEYFKIGQSEVVSQKLDQTKLPHVVSVTVEYKDILGEARTLKRIINLPVIK